MEFFLEYELFKFYKNIGILTNILSITPNISIYITNR